MKALEKKTDLASSDRHIANGALVNDNKLPSQTFIRFECYPLQTLLMVGASTIELSWDREPTRAVVTLTVTEAGRRDLSQAGIHLTTPGGLSSFVEIKSKNQLTLFFFDSDTLEPVIPTDPVEVMIVWLM